MSRLGFNTGYVEELYTQYLQDPGSVSESWQEFFREYRPTVSYQAAADARAARVAASVPAAVPVPVSPGDGSTAEVDAARPSPPGVSPVASAVVSADVAEDEWLPLRGPALKIAENMAASLNVPTATSVRTFPVKLLAENRALINDHQKYVGGPKVSFTHIIAWAMVRGLREVPSMNASFRTKDGEPYHVKHRHVNLGLAIDIERRGRRSLLVPNVKKADSMSFPQFLGIYNDLVERARTGKLEISDFDGTTATITNPGTLGTTLSIPRLMENQGMIFGVGSIDYPADYHAYSPEVVSRAGVSQVMTVTSTYDHRIIQGAESGSFLALVTRLLLGQDAFYDSIFEDLGIPHRPYVLTADNTPQLGYVDESAEVGMIRKQARVLQLIRAYRVRGHLQADINPLGNSWEYHAELDPASYGLTIWDLDRKFDCNGLGGNSVMFLRDILDLLRATYSRRVGVEYMHISDPDEKRWLQDKVESADATAPDSAAKRRILSKMNAAEAFERFLHTKYIGHKRYSLEGSETVIPMLDVLLSSAADDGVDEVVIGMAHRGRLNVLANVMQKPYTTIFSEFEGSIDPNTMQGSGDVKYHLGATGIHEAPSGASVKLTLASNPSHLEAVSPVVEGMVRAKQVLLERARERRTDGDYFDAVMPVLIHGDASFPGQGVVAETLNLSQLAGYSTGGTIHLVINNQIGFTTAPSEARSSTYATDVARMIQAPIFHVNGDDPEECVRITKIAFQYRQVFNRDVVVDLLCYRVHGHNEGDEPTYTQPLLYKKIEAKRSVRLLYTEALLARGEMKPDEAEQMLEDYRARLEYAFDETKEVAERDPNDFLARREQRRAKPTTFVPVETAIPREVVERVVDVTNRVPEWFNVHPKLARQFTRRAELFASEGRIDWGLAEAIAIGSLLVEGTTVRLAGQDTQRGTFSHRHSVLVDQTTGDEYVPLNHLQEGQANLYVYDSLLSEYAACAFEYGYSVADPSALVMWEAQFGDFANGAQIVFDQFLSAAQEKWGQESGLVLLLPHGYEGQGPEHSSARLERFLQLCGEDNMAVCNFTTPANMFHALRRQTRLTPRKPLVVMSPKSLLRHPKVISTPSDFVDGRFQTLIPSTHGSGAIRRHVFCSGKVYYDLIPVIEAQGVTDVAVTRIEQLYPFPEADVRAELERYGDAASIVWLQEEPSNMGAWSFVGPFFDDILSDRSNDPCRRMQYIGRARSASPSAGSTKVHQTETDEILRRVLAP